MKAQMIRVISSPSSSTTGFFTSIFATGGRCYLPCRDAAVSAPPRWGNRRRCHNRHRMATVERRAFGNHRVVNQPPPLVDYNLFEADAPLVEAVDREGAGWAVERISTAGAMDGSERIQALG